MKGFAKGAKELSRMKSLGSILPQQKKWFITPFVGSKKVYSVFEIYFNAAIDIVNTAGDHFEKHPYSPCPYES